MLHYHFGIRRYQVIEPEGCYAYSKYAEYERGGSQFFIPGCVAELQVLFILYRAHSCGPDCTQDVDRSDHDGCTGEHGCHAVKGISVLPGANEYCHLCHEATEAGQTQGT